MRDFLHDVRLALRGLLGRPGFSLVAVSTIALGIAAAGAIWSVVDAVLVRPLPFSEPERLVFVWEQQARAPARPQRGGPGQPDRLARARPLVLRPRRLHPLRREPRRLRRGARADPGGLHHRQSLQRPRHAAAPRPHAPRVGLGPGRRRRGAAHRRGTGAAASAPIRRPWGRRCGINGEPSTMVGVMPGSVQIPPGAVLWAPFTIDERMRTAGGRYLTVVGRLREGVSVAQAHDEMARLGDALAAENKDLNAGWGVNVQPLHADLVRAGAPGAGAAARRGRGAAADRLRERGQPAAREGRRARARARDPRGARGRARAPAAPAAHREPGARGARRRRSAPPWAARCSARSSCCCRRRSPRW